MRKGISLVALVITIIVLIILTAAVMLTGGNVPDKAGLAVFGNDLGNVQSAIVLQISDNYSEMYPETTDPSQLKNRYYHVLAGTLTSDVITTDDAKTKFVKNGSDMTASLVLPYTPNGESTATNINLYKVDVDNLNITKTAPNYYIDATGKVYYVEARTENNTTTYVPKNINGVNYITTDINSENGTIGTITVGA